MCVCERRFQVAQIPEMKSGCKDVTQIESSDTDSVDSAHTVLPEERSLLGVSSTSNSASSKCRQEVSHLKWGTGTLQYGLVVVIIL